MIDYNIESIDYFVVLVYLIGIFTLAFKTGRLSQVNKSDILEDQYLAGKSLSFSQSLLSIIATEVSALTFLGIPAFAYGQDFSFIQIYIGAILGRFLIAKYFMPKIYDKGLTIYSVMGANGTKGGQRSVAIFYSLNKFLAIGVRLFSGSILIAEFFFVSIYTAILIVSLLTFFYTLIGGLRAVVRTDMIQMFLFVAGGIIAHYMIPQVSNHSWLQLMQISYESGKLSFFDINNLTPFFIGTIGGVLFDMATHGVDQDFVQRLTANESIEKAKKAIIFSSFLSIAVGFLFLGIGALLWAHYQLQAPPEVINDKLFAYFITHYFPSGLKGLMVAGVLAATMSTLDSTINALSASFYSDIANHQTINKKKIKSLYQRDTLIITITLVIIAFIASKSDQLLLLGLKITSWTAGTLLAIFIANVLIPNYIKSKLTSYCVIGAYVIGITSVYFTNSYLKAPWQWNVYVGCSSSLVFLWLIGVIKKSH